MSPAVEKILAEINNLTAAEQREIREAVGPKPHFPSPQPTAQLVNEIKGKYSFVATSSEAFAARKARGNRSRRPAQRHETVIYVLDASAIIAYLRGEPGADAVSEILIDPSSPVPRTRFESLRGLLRFLSGDGEKAARDAMRDVFALGVQLRNDLSDRVLASCGSAQGHGAPDFSARTASL